MLQFIVCNRLAGEGWDKTKLGKGGRLAVRLISEAWLVLRCGAAALGDQHPDDRYTDQGGDGV